MVAKTLLIVDDDEFVLDFVRRILEQKNYSLLCASSSKEALNIFSDHKDEISLLISDVMMPEINGPTLLKEIKKIREDLKILFISGYPNKDLEHLGVPHASSQFLAKPFDPTELLERVALILEE